MTKAEIIALVAEDTKLTKTLAAQAFDAIFRAITDAMVKGDRIALAGFGTFSVTERKARTGRNPRTGKEIKIAAKKAPKFSPGTVLKTAVAGVKIPAKVAAKPDAKKIVARPKKK